MKAYYYMVSFGQPYNHTKYFKAKSKRQISAYCKVEYRYTVIQIFDPYDKPTDGITYIDIAGTKLT